MIGKTILHYKILEKLGEGGMGVVYLAEDTKLKRRVAIKFLPHHVSANEDERKRFKIEAQAAAALSHPNIATTHAIEEQGDDIFIVMEYIDGKELKDIMKRKHAGAENFQSLQINDVINYAIQIADGLEAAHEKGIIHRDIKSSNIMITNNGNVKIMDFGLAKISGGSKLTKIGTTVGTVAYMSPEQAKGEETDYRTDIWSFGVVLYEMLTGQLPFTRDYDQATIYSILNEEPGKLAHFNDKVTGELEGIVLKALKKDKEERYQHIDEMLADLLKEQKNLEYTHAGYIKKTTGSTVISQSNEDDGSVQKKGTSASDSQLPKSVEAYAGTTVTKEIHASGKFSILKIAIVSIIFIALIIVGYLLFFTGGKTIDSLAVLPFVNINADENTEYLSDGMTESIINSLTRIPHLRVVPRSIVFQYKGKNPDIRDIGKQLDVGAVLTGRFVHRGQKLNVQVDLVDIRKQSQIWGEQYSSNIKGILSLQQEIVTNVTNHLRLVLSVEVKQRVDERPTEIPEAYQLYLQGRYFWNKRKAPDLEKAIGFFNKAIKIDTNFASAYAGLADSYLLQEQYSDMSMKESLPKAEYAAKKALEIDNSLTEVHTTLGMIYNMSWQWDRAEEEYKKAIQLRSDYATAHHWYAILLGTLNRPEEALEQALMAVQRDPVSITIIETVGISYVRLNKYDEALSYFNKAAEIDSNHYLAYMWKGLILLWQGNKVESLANLEKAARLANRSAESLGSLGYGYAYLGNRKKAFGVINELETKFKKQPSYNIAEVYAGLGDVDKIVELLNTAYKEKTGWISWLFLPKWDKYRSDPSFIAVLQKFNLTP